MNPKLKAMMAVIGVVSLSGIGFVMMTPTPATRTMTELRDAGITSGQRFTLICPERLTPAAKTRIRRRQPGVLRPLQTYAQVARVAVCFNPDGGSCFAPATGNLRLDGGEGHVVVPSLRRDLFNVSLDGGQDEDGEDVEVDDSYPYQIDGCQKLTCTQTNQREDAGAFLNPYVTGFCAALNRLAVQPSPCMIPNGWRADGGWCEEPCGVVDCKRALSDGGSRWFGFNVMPRRDAVGTQCVPVECGVVAGDVPSEWL